MAADAAAAAADAVATNCRGHGFMRAPNPTGKQLVSALFACEHLARIILGLLQVNGLFVSNMDKRRIPFPTRLMKRSVL